MLRALVLDLDGTILDTESAIYEAWQEVFRRRGVSLPLSEWLRAVGSSADAFDPYRYLEELVGPIDRAQVRAEAEAMAEERLAGLQPLPGVVELVREAKRLDFRLAVASSSPRAWVERFLRQAGLETLLTTRATADDVERVKPAPDLFLLAIRSLGVAPSEALAVEDSLNGVRAALAAGMRCVVVPNSLTRGEPFPEEVARLDSLEGWNPEALWALTSPPSGRAREVR